MESVRGKQWKRPGPRRRNLLKLGANPKKVHMATRSRKGYWRMSRNKIVQQCLTNRWLKEQGVPEMKEIWISTTETSHALSPESDRNRRMQCPSSVSGSEKPAKPDRMDGVKPACPVVWEG